MAKRDDVWSFRERRTKADWAGVTMGDAFKSELDYYTRLAAQRVFYAAARKVQKQAAIAAGQDPSKAVVRPQISPFYTGYPPAIAAHAALGMTAFLEFQGRVTERLLLTQIRPYLERAAELDAVEVDPQIYARVAGIVAQSVQQRLILEDLARVKPLASIETYRLFLAAQQTLRFASLSEIVNCIVLYGDVLPDWRGLELHPLTAELLAEVSAVSAPFFVELARTEPPRLVQLGIAWVRMICERLARFLPAPAGPRLPEPELPEIDDDTFDDAEPDTISRKFGHPDECPHGKDSIAPLAGPNPPSLFDPTSPGERMLSAMNDAQEAAGEGRFATPPERLAAPKLPPGFGGPKPLPDVAVLPETLAELGAALGEAGGQPAQWEDMRSDLVEQALRQAPFADGPLTGAPTDGHEVTVQFGEEQAGGELFDRAVELSDDDEAYRRLAGEADPVTRALRRALYPDVAEVPETEKLRTSGALDPARLAMGEVSNAVWKRYRIRERVDRRGRAVLLIACDGSGSLNASQMRMTKVLAAAWLQSTLKTEVQVIAGLYHSGEVRQGLQGTLVQWMYHPEKTPAISRADAARALVTLPDTGTGCQADALSLAFMVEEARRIARGGMVYMILLSDCAWNQSFRGPRSGQQEVRDFFKELREDAEDKLHTTLVALGARGGKEMDDLLDRVISVPDAQLRDPAAVARQIGVYVAEVLRERRALMARARDVVR